MIFIYIIFLLSSFHQGLIPSPTPWLPRKLHKTSDEGLCLALPSLYRWARLKFPFKKGIESNKSPSKIHSGEITCESHWDFVAGNSMRVSLF